MQISRDVNKRKRFLKTVFNAPKIFVSIFIQQPPKILESLIFFLCLNKYILNLLLFLLLLLLYGFPSLLLLLLLPVLFSSFVLFFATSVFYCRFWFMAKTRTSEKNSNVKKIIHSNLCLLILK